VNRLGVKPRGTRAVPPVDGDLRGRHKFFITVSRDQRNDDTATILSPDAFEQPGRRAPMGR